MTSIPEQELARIKARWSTDDLHRAEYWADLASRDIPWLIGEVEAAHDLRTALVAFHDSYDSGQDRFAVRGGLFRILREYDTRTRRG